MALTMPVDPNTMSTCTTLSWLHTSANVLREAEGQCPSAFLHAFLLARRVGAVVGGIAGVGCMSTSGATSTVTA